MAEAGVSSDMPLYISLSMSQKAIVLSPTSAWSCDSVYEITYYSIMSILQHAATRCNTLQHTVCACV